MSWRVVKSEHTPLTRLMRVCLLVTRRAQPCSSSFGIKKLQRKNEPQLLLIDEWKISKLRNRLLGIYRIITRVLSYYFEDAGQNFKWLHTISRLGPHLEQSPEDQNWVLPHYLSWQTLVKGDLGDESGRKDEIMDKDRGAVPAANWAGYNILHFQTTKSKQRLQGVERQRPSGTYFVRR